METLKAILDHYPLAPLLVVIGIGYLIRDASRARAADPGGRVAHPRPPRPGHDEEPALDP